MRLWVWSDIHLGQRDFTGPVFAEGFDQADVLVVAGDVCDGVGPSLSYLLNRVSRSLPVIFVLGNHEYFGSDPVSAVTEARTIAARHRRTMQIEVLEQSQAIVGNVRFLGCTLWTDFRLFPEREAEAIAAARSELPDFRWIDASNVQEGRLPRRFVPNDARAIHRKSLDWLRDQLAVPHSGPTVVVTHHAPHRRSVAERYELDPLTPAFVSDLSDLIDHFGPELWIHGHTHTSFDYQAGRTRIVCNPRGYGRERLDFDPRKIVVL